MPVKSVYNFVPAPKESEVFCPDWADQVSHDLPFSDGESGEIDITITAETPIFIRNGHSKEEEMNEFSHYVINGEKKYFIPATSLKGMFRNVLEILTLSEMNPKLVNNDRYAHRDLTDGSLYRNLYNSGEVRCGWLKVGENGLWEIEDCGVPQRISYSEIDKSFGTTFQSILTPEVYENVTNYLDKEKNIKFECEGKHYTKDKREYSYDLRNKKVSKKLKSSFKNAKGKYELINKKLNQEYHSINEIQRDGINYYLVFTGSPSFDKQKEFLFPIVSNTNVIPLSRDQEISKKKRKDFLFAYKDEDSNNISKDWDFWRGELKKENGRVPIFFTEENGEIKHFGLAFMYKLPYEHSIHEVLPIKTNKNGINLPELIFGKIGDEGLKGRVFVGNAKIAEGSNPTVLPMKKEILASPKASYLPFYLMQFDKRNGQYKYLSYQNEVELNGYKRYPVHNSGKDFSPEFLGNYDEIQKKNKKVFSFFKPLDKGVKFKVKVRFHNLNLVEIGALLSAITFHGNEKKAFHSLGSVKPYGYGKIKCTLTNLYTFKNNSDSINEYNLRNYLDYLRDFEKYMVSKFSYWLESPQLRSLLTYAEGLVENELSYMSVKGFVNLKNESSKQYLIPEIKIEKVNSIEEKFKPQNQLDMSEIMSFIQLKRYLNEHLKTWDDFSEQNKNVIRGKLIELYSNHGSSRREIDRLIKKNSSVIPSWLGKEQAQALYNKLTKNNQ